MGSERFNAINYTLIKNLIHNIANIQIKDGSMIINDTLVHHSLLDSYIYDKSFLDFIDLKHLFNHMVEYYGLKNEISISDPNNSIFHALLYEKIKNDNLSKNVLERLIKSLEIRENEHFPFYLKLNELDINNENKESYFHFFKDYALIFKTSDDYEKIMFENISDQEPVNDINTIKDTKMKLKNLYYFDMEEVSNDKKINFKKDQFDFASFFSDSYNFNKYIKPVNKISNYKREFFYFQLNYPLSYDNRKITIKKTSFYYSLINSIRFQIFDKYIDKTKDIKLKEMYIKRILNTTGNDKKNIRNIQHLINGNLKVFDSFIKTNALGFICKKKILEFIKEQDLSFLYSPTHILHIDLRKISKKLFLLHFFKSNKDKLEYILFNYDKIKEYDFIKDYRYLDYRKIKHDKKSLYIIPEELDYSYILSEDKTVNLEKIDKETIVELISLVDFNVPDYQFDAEKSRYINIKHFSEVLLLDENIEYIHLLHKDSDNDIYNSIFETESYAAYKNDKEVYDFFLDIDCINKKTINKMYYFQVFFNLN